MAAKPKLTLKLSAKDQREANRLKNAVHDAVTLVANAQIQAELLVRQYADFVYDHMTVGTPKK